VQHLSPAMLARFGLCRAVTMLGNRLEQAGLEVEIQVDEAVETLAPEAQLALYRIVQELIGNVTKHAQAHHLTLHLVSYAGGVKLFVSDDGCGFTLGSVASAKSTSMGVPGMQARAKLLNAELEIQSAPGQGTQTTLLLPI
jgi:signal transduction histidine kinase